MRETLMSTLEREFLLSSLSESKRLDGRSLTDRRDLKLRFGSQWGTAHVTLGETQVRGMHCSADGKLASKSLKSAFDAFRLWPGFLAH